MAMRALIVTTFNDRSEQAIYRALVAAGIEVDLVCHPEAPEQDPLRQAGVGIIPDRIRHRLDWPAVVRLRRRLRAKHYDLIHAPRNSTLSVALLASRGLRIGHIAYRGTIGHLSHWDPASWLTYLNPRVDRIICVSEAVREYLLGLGIRPDAAVTIHKGHDPAWYADLPCPALTSFGIPADAVVVGFTGNIRPVKGVEVLLESARMIPPDRRIHFLLVGEVRDADIRRQAEDPALRGRVHLAGFRKDAAALAGRCDIYVMPSVAREGLPRSVIEAMAQGVPPIVSKVGGMPELVVDGQSGLVVPPRDPAALADAIVTLALDANRRRKLGLQARERIQTDFHVATTAARMIALYRDVAANLRPQA